MRRSPVSGYPLCLAPTCRSLGPFMGWCGVHYRVRPGQLELDVKEPA